MAKPANTETRNPAGDHRLICLLLIAATVVVFWRVSGFDFTNTDDQLFVTENAVVQQGLTSQSVRWAFTSTWQSIWQPLTWLSYMLDREMSGGATASSWDASGARVFHLTNLALHLANVLLLYAFLSRITGLRWRSAFVALLFAVHPLHVESVAWVAERKDVLSTFFWILTMWAYVSYTRRPTVGRYLLSVAAFVLGLMAKPMLVTLPIVLLLLDYWPLNRLATQDRPKPRRLTWLDLVREKAPFLIIAAASSMGTFVVMRITGGIRASTDFPILTRIVNAVVNYARYVWMMLWPKSLAVFYPDRGSMLPIWMICLSVAALVSISVFALRSTKRRPYVLFGWLWYVVTLLPVCGLVQQGLLTTADHYAYVPLIGLFVIVAWGIPDLAAAVAHKAPSRQRWLAIPAAIVGLALIVLSYVQVGYWQNSETLFTHALKVTKNNSAASFCMGSVLNGRGDRAGAIRMYREALRIDPRFEDAEFGLGTAFAEEGKVDEAILHLQKAVKLRPDYLKARGNLGVMLAGKGKLDAAIAQYKEALKLDPGNELVLCNLKDAMAQKARKH